MSLRQSFKNPRERLRYTHDTHGALLTLVFIASPSLKLHRLPQFDGLLDWLVVFMSLELNAIADFHQSPAAVDESSSMLTPVSQQTVGRRAPQG